MKLVLLALLLSVLIASLTNAADRITGKAFATRSEVMARNGMAATSQPLATQAALDILKAGGNAIDAAIAANAMLALTEPTGCGLGGDLFAIAWVADDEKLVGLNGSGRSPRGMSAEWLLATLEEQGLEKIPPRGALPVTVPGCVDGWFTLHSAHGRLPMADVLEPAIRYARDGFPVTEVISHYWRLNAKVLREYDGFEEQFTFDGRTPETGEIFKNPNLADTLQALASGGRDAFYTGAIAETIADTVQRAGGKLSVEDLAEHRSEWVDPVSTSYRGVDVWELPPNGQGIAALQMLNVLEGYDLAKWGFGTAEHLHYLIEAKKLAFADRARFYADMAFANVPVDELISKEYAAARRAEIDRGRASKTDPPGHPAPRTLDEGDTIYLTTADRDGNMVSLIQSNYRGMGSGICPDGLGFILQDRGELFDLAPDRANSYAPGKRPFHTIIPAFATRDGAPWLSFGVMGGATQPQAHVQIICNLVDFGMNLQEAGDAPRMVHSGSSQPTGEVMEDGGTVALESGFHVEVRRALQRRGHKLQDSAGVFGGYQAILWDAERGIYRGASESRKDGHAAGY